LLFLHFNQYSNFPYYISEKLNRFKEQVVQTVEKRNEYLKKLEEKLADYDLKIAEIKFKVAEVQDDMKAEYLSQIENLEEKRDELAVTYGQLKQSTGNAWTDIKTGTEKAWLSLEKSIEKAITRFK
jgi:chromosome segregation ATPase